MQSTHDKKINHGLQIAPIVVGDNWVLGSFGGDEGQPIESDW